MIELIVEWLFGWLHRFAGWTTLEIRVAIATARAARKHGLTLDRRRLRVALNEPGFLDGLESVDRSHVAHVRLAGMLAPSPNAIELAEVREALLDARLARLDGGSEALVAKDRLDRSRLDALGRKFDESDAASALFESHLSVLLPLRAAALRNIHRIYPRTAHVIGDILKAPDRAQRLKDWAESVPAAIEQAPVDIFGALADLAVDFGDLTTSNTFIAKGLERGLTPRAYWEVVLADRRSTPSTTADELRSWLAAYLSYPLAKAMLLDGGPSVAVDNLRRWAPSEPREDEHRRILLGHLLQRDRRLDEAIVVADEAYAMYESRAAAALGVQARVARHELRGAGATGADLEDALSFVERARADRGRRGLRVDNELAWTLRLLRLMVDIRGALSLVADLAVDPSTAPMLRFPVLADEVALLYAAEGNAELARQYLSDSGSTTATRVEAMLAERDGRVDDAIALWKSVETNSTDWNDRATAALRLGLLGVESSFVGELRTANAQIASEIELAAALFSKRAGAVAQAREQAASSRAAVDFLLLYFQQQGDTAQALVLARDAAHRMGDADLWLETARLQRVEGNPHAALTAAKEAVMRSSPRWGRRKLAFRMMVEIASSVGDWQSARDAAAQLLSSEPEDPSATWALTYCLVRLNDGEGALAAWRDHGRPDPYDTMSIEAWTQLVREFGDEVGTPSDALRHAGRFATDQHVRQRLVGAFILQSRAPGAADEALDDGPEGATAQISETAQAFQTLMADFLRDFPDGPLRVVTVDTEDLLGSLARELGEAPDTSELDEKILHGQLPVALAAEATNRELATVLARRARFGPVFAAPSTEAGRQAVESAESAQVVLDATAGSTLALMPAAVRTLLTGCFSSIHVTLSQQADAHEAALAASRDSGLMLIPPRKGQPVGLASHSDAELAAHRDHLAAVESVLRMATAVSHTGGAGVPELQDMQWRRPGFDALGLAIATARPLWADDRALAMVAQAAGHSVFSTVDVLEIAAQTGLITPDERSIAIAGLLTHGYVGFPFTTETWGVAPTLTSSIAGLLTAARHADPDEVSARVAWFLDLTDLACEDPVSLRDVVGVAAEWVQQIAGTEEQASINITQLSRLLLTRSWLSSSTLPWCLLALKNERLRVDAVSILLHELYRVFEGLAKRATPQLSATFVFELVSQLEGVDAERVRSAILRDRFE